VPSALAVGAILLVAVGLSLASLRSQNPPAMLLAVAALGATTLWVADILVLDRDPLRITRRAQATTSTVERLRLVDFNVLHGYPHFPEQETRARRAVAAIQALDADLIVLQEAWRTQAHGDFVERLATALNMDSAFARANGKLERIGFEEGEAVLSRFPILEAKRLRLAPKKPFYERRVALLCTLDLGGEPLTVVGAHLDNRNLETAAAQAATLAYYLRGTDAPIVAGDLNAGDDSAAVGALLDLGLRDLLDGGVDHVLFPRASSWRVESAAWTLRPAELEVLIGERAVISDHPGIVVDLIRR
jgi:endonuclease/exonuclease/phosphatase family metal-dependent hydrolase